MAGTVRRTLRCSRAERAEIRERAKALGTFHGLRRAHLPRYLDEFVFRWNRRRHTAAAFDTLLAIGTRVPPASYRDIVEQRA